MFIMKLTLVEDEETKREKSYYHVELNNFGYV